MKLTNKILDAVNRGIKFALDDYNDQDEIQGQVSSKVNNTSNLKEYLEWQQLINKLENKELTKQDIEELAKISKLLNLKYIVNSTVNLEDIIDYIDKIDHNANLNWIDTSKLKDMSSLFANKYDFNGDISEWDVSNVRNMSRMFEYSAFNRDISQWNVSKVENMSRMFAYSAFDGDISQWNVSKVKNMTQMFYDSCFNNDISKWDISSLNYMKDMFVCSNFKGDISNWNINNVIDYDDHIFDNCSIKDEYMPKFNII